jgi:hypothetical protein
LGEGGVKEIALAMDAALDRAGNESFFGLWDSGIAKGGDDLLAGEPFAIAIGMNELNEARAADDFCSKKHLLNRIAKKKSPVNQKAQKLGTTTQNKNLCSCYSITYINPMDKRTKLFQIFEKLGLEAIQGLPDDASIDQIADRVEFMAAIQKGVDDIDCGDTVPHQEIKKQLAKWLIE